MHLWIIPFNEFGQLPYSTQQPPYSDPGWGQVRTCRYGIFVDMPIRRFWCLPICRYFHMIFIVFTKHGHYDVYVFKITKHR